MYVQSPHISRTERLDTPMRHLGQRPSRVRPVVEAIGAFSSDVLDVGCGMGQFRGSMSPVGPHRAGSIGVDLARFYADADS